MKKKLSKMIEGYRIVIGPLKSDESFGMNGAFIIPYKKRRLNVIVSDGDGWDHVSVSLTYRIPTWTEMCFVKNIFFDSEETVIQFHPKKSEYINNQPHVLHMWRKQGVDYELPPWELVGFK